MNADYTIRLAEESDAQAIHDIYGEYVDRLDVTFTVINPSVEEYRQSIVNGGKIYPFYVAQDSAGKVLAYCCGHKLRPHDAYRWNVESTIVLSESAPKRKGIATALYTKFIDTLKELNYQYVYGVIVDNNTASIALHNSLGFKEVGHFYNVGYKQGKWLGIVWMCKYIGDSDKVVEEPLPLRD
ncbi:MAG: N-acetyltransferase family protein [Marinilabiliaceae bacterium]|nr:N-acetyltransferase family protein [Marinilabiliaceae bacterium]